MPLLFSHESDGKRNPGISDSLMLPGLDNNDSDQKYSNNSDDDDDDEVLSRSCCGSTAVLADKDDTADVV